MTYTIYLRTNKVNGMQYVGYSGNFYYREHDWKCLKNRYSNKYINEDREKYGLNNWELDILAEVETQEEAWELEKKFIKELNTKYPNGYNMSDGGVGTSGLEHLEETKKKISKSHINNPKKSKSVNQYDLDNNFVKLWPSTREIERKLGLSHGDIWRCLNGRRKSAGGYIWKYA